MPQNGPEPESLNESLHQILASSAVTSIDDVITVLRDFDTVLPNDDGLKWFNLLYLRTSESIRDNPPQGGFENPRWVERLDVVFANRYFSAISAIGGSPDTPRAWLPLFRARHSRGIARVQFALAGANAHINHDLPLALVETDKQLGIAPSPDGQEHRDFEQVNSILERTEGEVKQFLATGIVGEIDEDLGDIDDVIAVWSVQRARETAWNNAELLWHLQDASELAANFVLTLDRLVGLGSQGLLAPVLLS
jgi:hypothetical protein